MAQWDEMDEDQKVEHFVEVLEQMQEMPAEHKVWDSVRKHLNELTIRRVQHDPTKLYTKDEALLLYVQELRDRDGEEMLEVLQQVDPMWDGYCWDDDTELFVPKGQQCGA
jgi:hypothetical protein